MRKKIAIIISILLIAASFLSGCARVNKAPTAIIRASPLSGQVPLTVNFNGQNSVDKDGSVVSYNWDFGDGNTSTESKITYTYTKIGIYYATLVVTDNEGETDEVNVIVNVLEEPVFNKDKAMDILMDSIIDPSSSNTEISAFMLSELLQPGDVITSDSGETYNIDNKTWFIFIDDMPWAFFAHPTRYVLIDSQTGETTVINEFWPPLINNESMWNDSGHNRGVVTDMYPILDKSVPIDTDVSSGAPSADYGDAPDTQDAYYGVTGAFPTYYDTTNSRVGYHGGHALTVGEEMLGLTVSAEVDADDPNDPDLAPNLVDSDKDERMFVSLSTQSGQLSFTVTVDASAPDIARYVNVLIDFDQNGSWMEGPYGEEWVLKNYEVNVTPSTTETITTPSFAWGNGTDLPTPCWMRVALTREKVNETLFATVGGWDGSGQFEYGEIEDHIVYLTDDSPDPDDEWPPVPKEPTNGGNGGGGGGNGGPQPPGPTTGPCGTTVNYHCLIINGGDSSSHLGKGQTPAADAVDTMTGLLDDQGYNNVGSLGPGGNSLSDIASAFADLKSAVQCGDHVLIYIIGHGKPASKGGGVTLRGTDGKTDETMKPQDLADLLNTIPPCPDEDCDEEGKCCHVTVVIESCYAGNFNVDGVTGTGRTVMGSCDDEPADASGGGVFTSGFSAASNDENNDANDDDTVDPQEAYDQAESDVEDNNAATGRSQEPWIDSQECECKCPCSPSIDVDKWVWDDDDWVEEMDAYLGATVLFAIDIENDGVCRNVSELELVDTLPSCLSYGDDAVVTYTDSGGTENELSLSPAMADAVDGGMTLTWDIGGEIGLFAPGETISIEYSATTLELGENTNYVDGSARCTYDDSIIVTDTDSATVNVLEEPEDELPPPVEETIDVFVHVNATSSGTLEECIATITFDSYGATDLTGGDYPITSVILKIGGVTEQDSGTISTNHYQNSYQTDADCDTTFSVIATNSIGQERTYTGSITSILVLTGTIEGKAISVIEGESCTSTLYVWYNATDNTGVAPITNVILNINGGEEVNLDMSQTEYLGYYSDGAICGETYELEMIATNSNGRTVTATTSVTAPAPPT